MLYYQHALSKEEVIICLCDETSNLKGYFQISSCKGIYSYYMEVNPKYKRTNKYGSRGFLIALFYACMFISNKLPNETKFVGSGDDEKKAGKLTLDYLFSEGLIESVDEGYFSISKEGKTYVQDLFQDALVWSKTKLKEEITADDLSSLQKP